MVEIEPKIRAWLAKNVHARVVTDGVPADPTFPIVEINLVGVNDLEDASASNAKRYTVVIKSYGKTYREARKISLEVEDAMNALDTQPYFFDVTEISRYESQKTAQYTAFNSGYVILFIS